MKPGGSPERSSSAAAVFAKFAERSGKMSNSMKAKVAVINKTKGIDLADPVIVRNATDLHAYTAELQANPNIRVIANRNDVLLKAEDLAWLESTFAPAHLTLFEHGGHLGNLSQPAVQRAILGALDGLGAFQKKTKMEASL